MNNEQIDNADYYRLPCGKQLEDFMWRQHLRFHFGSALKYLYRAGKKDGESKEKDMKKFRHYCEYISSNVGIRYSDVVAEVVLYRDMANEWDGGDE